MLSRGSVLGVLVLMASAVVGCRSEIAESETADQSLTATPVTIVSGGSPEAVTVAGEYVYWIDSGAIFRKRASGISGSTTLAPTSVWATAIHVADGYLYYASGKGTIARIDLADNSTQTLASGLHYSERITVGGGRVFWIDDLDWCLTKRCSPSVGNLVLKSVSLGGGAVSSVASAAHPMAITSDDAYLYWTEQGGAVKRMPLIGGTPDTIATTGETFYDSAIAVDGTNLYWASFPKSAPTTEQIMAVPKAGGVTSLLATTNVVYTRLASDGHYLYIAAGSGIHPGSLTRVPVSGGVVESIAANQVVPTSVALDATHVYWANIRGGIWRLAK